MERVQGYVEQGSPTVDIDGVTKDTPVQICYPGATVSVYDTGTTNLATIYADDAMTPKANPFTAGDDASWFFYVDNGRYDVQFSDAGIVTPFGPADISIRVDSSGMAAVSSVFGRTGNVVAAASDYDFTDISGTVAVGQLPAAGGDLSGTLANAAVVGLQGRSINNGAPTAGQALVWTDSSSGEWRPGTPTYGMNHASLANLDAPSSGHTGFATLLGVETFENKTLTTPIIGSFVNATHNHENAAGGGQIDSDALASAVTAVKGGTGQTSYAKGDILVATGASALTKLTVGSDGQVLTADAAATSGIKWASTSLAPHSFLSATAELTYDSTAAQSFQDKTIGVTGAAVGDPVVLGTPAVIPDSSCYSAWVSAADTVSVRFNNYSSSILCPGTGNFSVVVFL